MTEREGPTKTLPQRMKDALGALNDVYADAKEVAYSGINPPTAANETKLALDAISAAQGAAKAAAKALVAWAEKAQETDGEEPQKEPDPEPEDPVPAEPRPEPENEFEGAPTYEAIPGGWRKAGGGPKIARFPIVEALRDAARHDRARILVYGRHMHDPVQIGGGHAGQKGYVAHWGAKPMRVQVIGADPTASMAALSMENGLNNGTYTGGAELLELRDLEVRCRYQSAISSPLNATVGTLRIRGVHLAKSMEEPNGEGGFGMKWGIRMGRANFDVDGLSCDPVQEHVLYANSPQGERNAFRNVTHLGSTRTCIQIVNRFLETPGPPSSGLLIFEDIEGRNLSGDGGYLVTVAGGHLGTIVARNLRLDNSNATRGKGQGLFVCWMDSQTISKHKVTGETVPFDHPEADTYGAHGSYGFEDPVTGQVFGFGDVHLESLWLNNAGNPWADAVKVSSAKSCTLSGLWDVNNHPRKVFVLDDERYGHSNNGKRADGSIIPGHVLMGNGEYLPQTKTWGTGEFLNRADGVDFQGPLAGPTLAEDA